MLQWGLRICWKWSTFWKACNKQNTWECWTCTACNNKDRCLAMWELEADLGIPKTPVSEALTHNFGMKCIVAKFILWLLLPEQKEHRAAIANDLIHTATNEPDFPKKVITKGESWVCTQEYDPETKTQSSQWKLPDSPSPKKVQQSVFLIGKVLSIMSTPLQAKQLIRNTTSLFFVGWEMQYNENSRSYGQLVIGSFITTTSQLMHHVWCRFFEETSKSPRWLSHPHSPDLEPCNCWLLSKLKSPLFF